MGKTFSRKGIWTVTLQAEPFLTVHMAIPRIQFQIDNTCSKYNISWDNKVLTSDPARQRVAKGKLKKRLTGRRSADYPLTHTPRTTLRTTPSDYPKAWFILRHKHKHKHKHKHNECSHLLHKHKESGIRKHNELQNEAAGVWDETLFHG